MTFASLTDKLHTHSIYRYSSHLLFWALELFITWYTLVISFNIYKDFNGQVIWWLAIFNTVNLAFVYYPLVYFLLPLFNKRNYLAGVLGLLILLIVYGVVNTLTEQFIITKCESCMLRLKVNSSAYYQFLQGLFINRLFAKVATMGLLIGLVFSVSIPLVIKIALGSFRQQLAAVKLAKENVELEFGFLKSQINPHFLFNSLNNIYGLILKKENDKAAGTVARLAEFMRYTLHSPGSDQAPLQKEIKLLQDYIDLEKIRLNHIAVNFELESQNENQLLPSLLLIPLIENAFKYSVDQPGSEINIRLVIEASNLQLTVTNTVDVNRQLHTGGGIGLQNLKKRLELYYPGNYNYEATETGQLYTCRLKINL
jgi:sensor histidine kinase YesM